MMRRFCRHCHLYRSAKCVAGRPASWSCRHNIFGLIIVLLLTLHAHAQQIGTNAAPDKADTYTLQVKSQLVVETVVVKDKQGHTLDGLTAKDFTLTEDGVPQKIRYCELQTLPTDVAPLAPSKSDDEQIKIYKRLARTQVSTESNGQAKFKGSPSSRLLLRHERHAA